MNRTLMIALLGLLGIGTIIALSSFSKTELPADTPSPPPGGSPSPTPVTPPRSKMPWETLSTNQLFEAGTGFPMFPVIKLAPWANNQPQFTEAYILFFHNFQIVSEPIGENKESPFRAILTNKAYYINDTGAVMLRTSVSPAYDYQTNDISSVKLDTQYRSDWINHPMGYLIVKNVVYAKRNL